MTLRICVVDDEKPAREELAWLLEQCDDVIVEAFATNATQAQECLKEHEIDLVFLDIDMPGVGGMRLAETIRSVDGPAIIFVTAHDGHAIEAFGLDAVDYLLKPVRLERLQQALERTRKRLAPPATARPKPLGRISVEEKGVYQVVQVQEILFFEADMGVVVVQTRQRRWITDFSLKFLEQNLDPDQFFRCHRSYIVNLDAIESIAPWGAGTFRLILDRDADLGVPLARSRASQLKSLIPWSAGVFDD